MIKKLMSTACMALLALPSYADQADMELLNAEGAMIPMERVEHEKGGKAIIVNSDSMIEHKVSGLVSYRDNSYQIFFKKPSPSNNYMGVQHECGTSSLKHRFFLNPKSKSFDIKKDMIESGNISSIGYKCVNYKKWGVVAMIKIVRSTSN